MRFSPDASAALIWARVLDGVAMKKLLMGREVPVPSPPPDQLVPDELVRRPGENTH
jgi:hypothetical protein